MSRVSDQARMILFIIARCVYRIRKALEKKKKQKTMRSANPWRNVRDVGVLYDLHNTTAENRIVIVCSPFEANAISRTRSLRQVYSSYIHTPIHLINTLLPKQTHMWHRNLHVMLPASQRFPSVLPFLYLCSMLPMLKHQTLQRTHQAHKQQN